MENIIGKKFGRLTVLEKTKEKNKYGSYFYKCRCDCGNIHLVISRDLKDNSTKSCGCLHKDSSIKNLSKIPNKFIPNKIEEKEDYIILKVESKGYIYDCLIDKEDYEKIKEYKWHLNKFGYIITNSKKQNGKRIHRMIMNYEGKNVIDHINHNRMDNRKCNLRICNLAENSWNRKSKGYYYIKKENRWSASIMKNGKYIYLGYFKTEEEAKEARRQAEIKYFGEFRYKD